MTTALSSVLQSSLLMDLCTYTVQNSVIDGVDDSSPFRRLAAKAVATGTAELLLNPSGERDDQQVARCAAAVAIPIFRNSQVISVAVIAIGPKNQGAGVIELWEPIAPYEEVRLRAGYFAHLERFSNVSSFVRFEKGNGLPGQVWSSGKAIIHNDLANHPGFLRAAGASAGLLETAIGIPVVQDELKTVVVLISAGATPLARGYEVWVRSNDQFKLDDCAYHDLDSELQLDRGVLMDADKGLPGLAMQCDGAALTEDSLVVGHQRRGDAGSLNGGFAIPFYQDGQLSSVSTLVF